MKTSGLEVRHRSILALNEKHMSQLRCVAFAEAFLGLESLTQTIA